MNSGIVIHGSALKTPTPRDVDAIYKGVAREFAETVVREWCEREGVTPTTSEIDLVETEYLYRPYGVGSFRRIYGTMTPRLLDAQTLSAALRAFGKNWPALEATIVKLGLDQAGLELYESTDEDGLWSYTEGPRALRSALRHVLPRVRERIANAWPWLGTVLDRCEVGWPDEWMFTARDGAPAASGVRGCTVTPFGIHTRYGGLQRQMPWSVAQADYEEKQRAQRAFVSYDALHGGGT